MVPELVTGLGGAVAVVSVAAAAAELFRAFGKRYSAELGAVKVELESAEKDSRKTEEELGREIDRWLASITATKTPEREDSGELTNEIAEGIRAELSKLRQVGESRAEQILSDQYHRQGLAQSNLAFQLSLVFAGLGFLIIAASAVVVLASGDVPSGIVAVVSGAIVEAVSGLFFVQANQTRRLMVQFFDRLRTDRSLEEALKLSNAVPDPTIRSRLGTLLAVRLASADATDDVLRTIMGASTEPGAPAG